MLLSRKIKIAISCCLIGVTILVAPVVLRFWHMYSFASQKAAGAELIESLRDRGPATVSRETWDNAITWTMTAYHNVFFSVDSVTVDELVRFTNDAKTELEGNVDTESVDWVWARLAETGSYGKEYVAKTEPLYRSVYERERNSGLNGTTDLLKEP